MGETMKIWQEALRYDPIPPLLTNEALEYFTRRDLLDEPVGPVEHLWKLPRAQKIAARQQEDGSWKRPGKQKHDAINHNLIETFRQFRFLVQMYGFTRESPIGEKAAEFILSCQTEEGDIRGILANQYATYYTGALLFLLVEAGYGDDPRAENAFQWLLAMRQDDGAWSVPMITHKLDRDTQYELSSEYREPLQPDRTKPFSHNATGMILRAFAAHPRHRKDEAAIHAAKLLASRFFQKDAYTSYQAERYWIMFQYPYWWNQLVAALDSISFIGISKENDNVNKALNWLIEHQQESGLWKSSYAESGKAHAGSKGSEHWVSLAICRVLKRYAG
jgi:hypothetical protein